MTSPALLARRDEYEASMRSLATSHGTRNRPGCTGYHDQRRPAGRTVRARFVCLFNDGTIAALCARCAYGLDGIDITERLPIRDQHEATDG